VEIRYSLWLISHYFTTVSFLISSIISTFRTLPDFIAQSQAMRSIVPVIQSWIRIGGDTCDGELGASYRNLTEILPKSYNFLPCLPYTSPHYAVSPVVSPRSVNLASTFGHVVSRQAIYCLAYTYYNTVGIKCNRESYRGGDGIQDSLALGKYGAARNCGRTRNGCHTACAHQCRRANRLQSSDLFASDRTGAMLTQPQRAGAGPRPQQHHGIRREL
jgi:hypothetical protein